MTPLLFALACAPAVDTLDSGTAPAAPVTNTPPTVTIEALVTDDPEAPVHIRGSAWDEDQPVITLWVVVEATGAGVLWEGNPHGTGLWSWTGTLPQGEHWAAATVYDQYGVGTAVEATIVVEPPVVEPDDPVEPEVFPPSCGIDSPTDNFTARAGTDVWFAGWVEDEDGDTDPPVWHDGDDPMFAGTEGNALLAVGTHTVTFSVQDRAGNDCRDTVQVVVEG